MEAKATWGLRDSHHGGGGARALEEGLANALGSCARGHEVPGSAGPFLLGPPGPPAG